jgi:hypothetical protein
VRLLVVGGSIASRAISYYSYLLWARSGAADRDAEPFIGDVLAESAFRDFLSRVPPSHLLTQLHMFSERLDPGEARRERARLLGGLLHRDLLGGPEGARPGASARSGGEEERRFGEKAVLTEAELGLLRERLAPEYAMIDRVRESMMAPADDR